MKEELDSAEVPNFLNDLRELLSEQAENVQLSNRRLTEFPEIFELANRKCKKILDMRTKEVTRKAAETEERARAEEQTRAEERASAEAQITEERFLLDSSPNTPNASRDVLSDFGNIRIDGSNDHHNDSHTVSKITNEPCMNFASFIQEDGAYLTLKKQKWPTKLQHGLKNELVKFPLGVAYDEVLKLWLICDKNTDKIVLMNVHMESIRVREDIKKPTAIIVYEEGKNVALLCSEGNNQSIYIYNHSDEEPLIQAFATYQEQVYDIKFELRGLAKSVSGNLLSLERNRLRIFKRNVGGKGYHLRGAGNPCFIATYRTTVAVSDLGTNKVFLFNLDDKNWDSISFNPLHVIETTASVSTPLIELADQTGFRFVAGIQFDCNGFLLIGDAKGHSIKLYNPEFTFLHRVSSDFVLPYVSSFHVNKDGECILLDVRNKRETLLWVKLTDIPTMLPWHAPTDDDEDRFRKHDRGGYNQKRTF